MSNLPAKSSAFRVNADADSNGTSLRGHITACYRDLVAAFGEPMEADEYKVSGSWAFETPSGEVFTIYDWKSTSMYDSDLPSVEEFRSLPSTTFNVGGRTDASQFIQAVQMELVRVRGELVTDRKSLITDYAERMKNIRGE